MTESEISPFAKFHDVLTEIMPVDSWVRRRILDAARYNDEWSVEALTTGERVEKDCVAKNLHALTKKQFGYSYGFVLGFVRAAASAFVPSPMSNHVAASIVSKSGIILNEKTRILVQEVLDSLLFHHNSHASSVQMLRQTCLYNLYNPPFESYALEPPGLEEATFPYVKSKSVLMHVFGPPSLEKQDYAAELFSLFEDASVIVKEPTEEYSHFAERVLNSMSGAVIAVTDDLVVIQALCDFFMYIGICYFSNTMFVDYASYPCSYKNLDDYTFVNKSSVAEFVKQPKQCMVDMFLGNPTTGKVFDIVDRYKKSLPLRDTESMAELCNKITSDPQLGLDYALAQFMVELKPSVKKNVSGPGSVRVTFSNSKTVLYGPKMFVQGAVVGSIKNGPYQNVRFGMPVSGPEISTDFDKISVYPKFDGQTLLVSKFTDDEIFVSLPHFENEHGKWCTGTKYKSSYKFEDWMVDEMSPFCVEDCTYVFQYVNKRCLVKYPTSTIIYLGKIEGGNNYVPNTDLCIFSSTKMSELRKTLAHMSHTIATDGDSNLEPRGVIVISYLEGKMVSFVSQTFPEFKILSTSHRTTESLVEVLRKPIAIRFNLNIPTVLGNLSRAEELIDEILNELDKYKADKHAYFQLLNLQRPKIEYVKKCFEVLTKKFFLMKVDLQGPLSRLSDDKCTKKTNIFSKYFDVLSAMNFCFVGGDCSFFNEHLNGIRENCVDL